MKPIRIALAQFDFPAGAVEQNADRMLALAARARDELGARLILFPELAISGYLAEDLFLRPSFIEACERELVRVVDSLQGIDAVIGHPLREGALIYNALSWVRDGRVVVRYRKQALPNYTVFDDSKGKPAGINLLDYGCIRIFPPRFVGGVVDLYRGLLDGDDARVVHAYETWGFKRLSKPLIDALNIWARFIYGPLLDDRVRSIADGVKPSEYGRKEAFQVHQALKKRGPVMVPREFVFMDRAAVGLGAVFLHLAAELNFYRLFNEAIERFSIEQEAARQAAALSAVGLKPSAA